MKTLITLVLLTISTISFSQLAPPRQAIKLNLPPLSTGNENVAMRGPVLMLGGAAFIAAGLLTPPVMEGGSTTVKKSPINQLQRILPIVSGSGLFVVGVAVSLGR